MGHEGPRETHPGANAALRLPGRSAGPAQAYDCYTESVIFVRAGGDLGTGTQSTQYNHIRTPLCSNGNPMTNTTYIKLSADYRTYVETGYYQTIEFGRTRRTVFSEYGISPSTHPEVRYWEDVRATPVPTAAYVMYAISKLENDQYRILFASQPGGVYDHWDTTFQLGASLGRPESEVARFGSGSAEGDYSNLQFKDPTDATWHPWRSLNCDYVATKMTDWRVHRRSSTSWYSEHLPSSGSGCE